MTAMGLFMCARRDIGSLEGWVLPKHTSDITCACVPVLAALQGSTLVHMPGLRPSLEPLVVYMRRSTCVLLPSGSGILVANNTDQSVSIVVCHPLHWGGQLQAKAMTAHLLCSCSCTWDRSAGICLDDVDEAVQRKCFTFGCGGFWHG